MTPTWQNAGKSPGWHKGNFDMRMVMNPRTKKIDFVATRERSLRLPRETKGRRWRVWTCSCGARRTFVAFKMGNGRRLYSLGDLEWAEKHAGCK